MPSYTRALSWASAAAVVLGLAGSARGDFDPTKGKVVLDGATATVDFDGPSSLGNFGPVRRFDAQFNTLEAIDATEWIDDVVVAIEGQGALRLGRGVSSVYFSLDSVAGRLKDRRVTFTLWVRAGGALPVAEVAYTARPLAEAAPADFFQPLGLVRLQPTGRATSDGWRELSSGPVDFDLHGDVEARFIQILDERLVEASIRGFGSNNNAEMLIDALAITDVGPRAVPDVACTLPAEAAQCGLEGSCLYGRCVDAHAALGNPPPIGPVRDQYLARLSFRMEMMAGGRYTQDVMPTFNAALQRMSTETRRAEYWSTYYRAFDDLGDGHISAPGWRRRSTLDLGMCLNQGVADLLPGTSDTDPAPLVFDRSSSHPVARRLERGDVLVAVDGIPPEDWLELADRYVRYSGDPRGRAFVVTAQLPQAAVAAGARLTFARCGGTGGARCTEDQVDTIVIDLAEEVSSLWRGGSLGWSDIPCDFRFLRDVTMGNVFDGDFVGFRDVSGGAIRSVLINGVSGSESWGNNVLRAIDGSPSAFLIDERTGNGGTFVGVSLMAAPFWPANAQPLVQLAPQVRPELDQDTYSLFISCVQFGGNFCGNFSIRGMLQDGLRRGERANARVAIVNGRDVSGNDYLPRLLRARPSGATRIFGPVPTFGAFGPIYSLPRIMQELTGGSVQIQDSAFFDSVSRPSFAFATGFGVEPDEVVLQRQSDALRGVDTIMERAKAWLREGGQP